MPYAHICLFCFIILSASTFFVVHIVYLYVHHIILNTTCAYNAVYLLSLVIGDWLRCMYVCTYTLHSLNQYSMRKHWEFTTFDHLWILDLCGEGVTKWRLYAMSAFKGDTTQANMSGRFSNTTAAFGYSQRQWDTALRVRSLSCHWMNYSCLCSPVKAIVVLPKRVIDQGYLGSAPLRHQHESTSLHTQSSQPTMGTQGYRYSYMHWFSDDGQNGANTCTSSVWLWRRFG